ncbi:MAG: dienelactone hydrolase family protein [Polyangiaceae bacterium]
MRKHVFYMYFAAISSVFFAAACGGGDDSGANGGGDDSSANPGDGGGGRDGSVSTSGDGGSKTDGSPTGSGSLTPGTSTLTISAGGQSRSVLLHVPSQVAGHVIPLVIALHGDGDTSANFVTGTTQLESKSDADGFVLAAPQGITRDVMVGAQTVPQVDWDPYNDPPNNIDLPLLDAIESQLVASGSIDTKNISVYGYSQGGYMSFRYGMEAAASLSCAAVLAAGDPFGGSRPTLVTGAARKIPVSLQVGSDDNTGAVDTASEAHTELVNNGNPVQYNVISGAGHVPVPGDFSVPLDYCRGQSLP